MRTRGEGGGKKWYFCADVLYGWPQNIRVCPFFSFFNFFNFLRSLMREGVAKTAEPILTRDMSIDAVWRESDPFLEMKNIGQ